MKKLFTSESVTEWHPDKICDQISDSILDACLQQDPYARVACECLITTNKLVIAGEITTTATVDYEAIAKKTIVDIGYNSEEVFFDGNTCDVELLIDTQSPDIAMWVNTWWAWDQWLMFGYATNETDSFLPLAIDLAHRLAEKLSEVRKNGQLAYLRPDGKTQVTIAEEDGKVWVDTVVVSTQHSKDTNQDTLKKDIQELVIQPVIWDKLTDKTIFHINPTGNFYIGGPVGDTGLTGRKIIVDTYGWMGRHGWGAFSGKDATKVDRSAAYMARYLAKNIVASGLCDRCEIQLSYAIGVAQPVSIAVDCFGTQKVDTNDIIQAIYEKFDLTPVGIINKLELRKPIYSKTAAYGHFGRDIFSWEKIDSKSIFEVLKK